MIANKLGRKSLLSRRRWAVVGAVVLGLFVLAELFARLGLGLGDPPLSIADPEIEYLFKADQDCRRFGNRVLYNQHSMRSRRFPSRKTNPSELRVLCLGDSVINGGVLTDQENLATSLLEKRLAEILQRPVVVGNVSAGSWGPPNLLAYTRKFGWFEADVVVLIVSSHDAADVPTFEPLVGVSAQFPDQRPLLALQEGLTRYILPKFWAKSLPAKDASSTEADKNQGLALDALRQLLTEAQASGAAILVCQHWESEELDSGAKAGHQAIGDLVQQHTPHVIQLGPPLQLARSKRGNPYRDNIHLNETGQQVLAETLLAPILDAVEQIKPRQSQNGESGQLKTAPSRAL